jgi:squalene-hopene/tetraprenyl-beta-curcumene cyclase
MKARQAGSITFIVCLAMALAEGAGTWAQQPDPATAWNPRAAATYLDKRADWWETWPGARRDHDTACVSCHTALPYALARQALRVPLNEREPAPPEQMLLANVIKRVTLWKEVEPFYPDQTRGLPKTSESRGTEAVLNALILAARDGSAGHLSAEGERAFDNLWPLQFKAGDLKGTWAWLNFHYEPWESSDAAYFGGALAALASGMAPGYASRAEVQPQIALLREYLRQHADAQPLLNRVMLLWAAAKLEGVLQPAERDAIVDAIGARQHDDGGWSTADLGTFKRLDATALDRDSDGYATGLVALALQQSGRTRTDPLVANGLRWLARHQDRAAGSWYAASLNKQRELASDAGKFMSDAATAYAVLALTAGNVTPAGSAPPR